MSPETFIRGFFALLFSGALALGLYSREERESQTDSHLRYAPIFPAMLLPVFFAGALLGYPVLQYSDTIQKKLLSLSFSIFLHISIYYLLLMALLPLLRRTLRARSCALL